MVLGVEESLFFSSGALSADGLEPCADGELEGVCVAVAFDGEFDAAALARFWRPGGLPERVADAIGGDDGDFGDADYSGRISGGALADAGVVFVLEAVEKLVAVVFCGVEGILF